MKSRTNIKTRLLALVLTVLMTVGVLPFSVFAIDGVAGDERLELDNALFKAPTGAEIEEALGEDGELVYYNDYNKSAYDNASAYKSTISGLALSNGSIGFVDDGNGGHALKRTNYNDGTGTTDAVGTAGQINHSLNITSDRNGHPDLQGKNFVYSADYMLGGSINAGQFIVLGSWSNGNLDGCFTAIPVWIDASGNLYVTDTNWTTAKSNITGGCLWKLNDWEWDDEIVGDKIGQLSTTVYTNVAVQVKDNQFRVFVDGVDMTDWKVLMSDSAKAAYEASGYNADGGFALTHISSHYRANAATATDHFIHDNTTLYYADEYLSIYGKEYDSALTANDFVDNDLTLFHYNDFNNQTITSDGQTAPANYASSISIGADIDAWIRSGAGEAIVDDGRGGKAFTYKKVNTVSDTFQAYYQVNGVEDCGAATANSGRSFVVSSDFKLTYAATSGQLLCACAANANTDTYGADFKAQLVYTMEDGGIYIARKSDATSTGVYVNDNSSAWKNNIQKIGTLSTSFFTNIAVVVNVADNTMRVYINGVDATGELQFLTDSDKAVIDASAAYPNGFGYSYTRVNLLGSDYTANDAPIVIDNVAAYLADDIVKKNNNPLNGYMKDGNKYYCYNNGNIVTNFTSADGLLSAGLDGVVKYGVEAVDNMNSIYKYVGSDLIPVDGIYSGVYSYVKSANYYCYDANNRLIRNKTAFDAITEGITTDATKAVGFSIDGNGVATPLNGYIEVADNESYFYVNGIRTKGMVEIGGHIFFIAEDYSFFAGYREIDGKMYFFDANDGSKGALVNGVHFADTVNAKYYVDGVAQTGLINAHDTKYFADANGVLLTGIQTNPANGDKYFFYADGADKYKLAIGASVIWNNTIIRTDANGILDESSRAYGEWVEFDGKWYYSDASGNIATGFVYIEKDLTGAEGGYYYFDGNGDMVKEAFVEIYGATMYFHTDGKAYDGVVFVDADAVGFPADIILDAGAEGIYMHFVDGVRTTGVTEVIQDGYKFSFYNGVVDEYSALDENNPEILITIIKNGKKDSFYFNSEDNGEFNMLLTQYPCFTITVYDVTDKENPVQIPANAVIEGEPSGRYTLVGAHTYEIRYEVAEHVFGTTPVDTVEATCGADGYHVYKCTVDGCVATKKEAITERPDHVFTGVITTLVAPECTKDGVGVTWCVNPGCGASKTVTIPATGVHVFENWIVVPSTCTTAGYKYSECKYDCCYEYKHEPLPLADHVWGTYVETTKATCAAGGVETATCINCTATDTRTTAPDYDYHVHGIDGTLTSDQDACVDYFELFQVVRPSTCLENGFATYRCKECGGFVYEVVIELDPENHHYNADEEYLAVLDSEGNVIETVKIIDGQVYVDGAVVAAANSANDRRLEMLSYSKKICGYAAEWRIDCKKGCINPDDPTSDAADDAIIYYTVVEEVEHNYLHSFDLEKLYTTTNEKDPLYGFHFYKCQKCGRAAGVEAHEMTYTDNGDGTHNYHCKGNCVDEETGLLYGELNVACEFETNYNDDYHWLECICGAKSDEIEHTLTDDYDDEYHWSECSCGYINKVEHDWTDVDAKAPTCDETGYTAHKICACGAKSGYEVVGRIPHIFTGEYSVGPTGHWYACEECGFEYGLKSHNYVDVPELAPTCEANGYVAHQLCADCGYRDGYSVIDATGHNVTGQPYNYDDANHWQICAVCSERVTAAHTLGALLSDEEGTKQCGECEHIVVDLDLTWWKQLGLERVTVEGHYYYTYNGTKNALVVINDNYYYFDNNGYLVLNGDSGVNNANVKAPNGTFDSITEMANSRGIISDAIIATANGTFYLIDGEIQTNWQTIDGKDYFFNTKLGEELVADAAEGALIKPADGETTIIALNKPENAKILVNVDANGARLLGVVPNGDGTASYYLDGTAGKLTGRIEDNYYNIGKLYFANADGVLYSGEWTSVNGVYYSFNSDYSMSIWHINDTTELDIEGVPTEIFTDGEGRRIINGWYLAHGVGGRYIQNGEKIVGDETFAYMIIEDTYYAFDDQDGVVSYYTGWNDGNTLYIASGIIVKNRFESIEGNNYYFDGDGQIVKAASGETIKVVIGSWVYSIDDTGAANQYIVGGENPAVWVYFIVDGVVDTSAKGYLTTTGLITSQAIVIDTATYIFDENGRLVTSKDNYECNGVVYVIDAEGKATAKDEDDD